MERLEIGLANEWADGTCRILTVSGRAVGVFRLGDEFRAYLDVCPHAGAPVCTGLISETTLRCPWHGWEFDLHTGQHLGNPDVSLTSYRVEVEDGRVFVRA